jgi:hypothetical protein
MATGIQKHQTVNGQSVAHGTIPIVPEKRVKSFAGAGFHHSTGFRLAASLRRARASASKVFSGFLNNSIFEPKT